MLFLRIACDVRLLPGGTFVFLITAAGARCAPLDGAEIDVAEEVVSDADGSYRLVPVGQIGIVRIPMRFDVLDADSVTAVNTHRERRVPAEDLLQTSFVVGARAADIVLTPRQIEHGRLAEDEAEREQSLRGVAVVVVAYTRCGVAHGCDGAGCSETDAAEERTLERHRVREPPLGGGAEREGRARDTEGRRRYGA